MMFNSYLQQLSINVWYWVENIINYLQKIKKYELCSTYFG